MVNTDKSPTPPISEPRNSGNPSVKNKLSRSASIPSGGWLSAQVQGFHPASLLSAQTAKLREITSGKKAIAAISGGVDSTVATVLAKQALGDNLIPVLIDTGFMRLDEPEKVRAKLSSPPLGIKVRLIHAGGRFLEAVKGTFLAEEKRNKFRETFYQVLKDEAAREGCEFLVQGTIAPDWIETQGGIKTQHNVLEQVCIDPVSSFGFKIIEPLPDLYEGQVRILGRHLNMPGDMSRRQPFPGPGLLVRCIGSVSKTKLKLLKHATKIVEEKLGPFNYEQYCPAVIENRFAKNPEFKDLKDAAAEALDLPASETHVDVFEDRVTGVKGDDRIYGRLAGIKIKEDSRETFGWLPEKLRQAQVSIIDRSPEVTRVAVMVKERRGVPALSVVIRAVSTKDFMTAAVATVPWKILKDAAESILKTGGALRVYYDITPKPPATIEFE